MAKEIGAYITTTLMAADGNDHQALTSDFIPARLVSSQIGQNNPEFYKVAADTGFVTTIRWVEREILEEDSYGETPLLRH